MNSMLGAHAPKRTARVFQLFAGNNWPCHNSQQIPALLRAGTGIERVVMKSESRADAVIRHLKLEPLPVEGGLFRRTWQSQTTIGQQAAGSCIFAMLTADEDSFSAIHRLPFDEIWHFYTGDPIDLLLLHPDGSSEHTVFGSDVLNDQRCQVVVAAGTWMGAGLLPGGEFALFGCTMSPGFTPESYEGGDRQALIDQYPHERAAITRFTRLGVLSRCMPSGY